MTEARSEEAMLRRCDGSKFIKDGNAACKQNITLVNGNKLT